MPLFGGESVQEREAERNRRHSSHQQAQQAMFNDDGRLQGEYLQSLIDDGLDQDTVIHLRNMLSKDFVLANLDSAEVDELKWLTRVLKMKILAMHPPQESDVTGEYRKFLHDDPEDGLKPLSQHQRTIIDQVVRDVIVRISRSKGGWQQEEFGKTVNVSELKDNKDSSGGGLFR